MSTDRNGFRFEELPEGKRIARKGGKGGGGGSSPARPTEYPNTLRSRAHARIMEVLSEGVVAGISTYIDGGTNIDLWRGVYLDGTPVYTNSWNFSIAEAWMTAGTPAQDPIPGFSMAEAEVAVGVECKPYDPVVKRLSGPNISSFRVTLRFPALYMTEQDGDINGTATAYQIDYQIDSSGWIYGYGETIWGKTMSPYERSFRLYIGYVAGTSIDVRVTKLWGAAGQGEAHTFFWSSVTEIQDGLLSYDDTSIFAATIDAEDFPNVPQRAYLLDGIQLQIPSNYNGRTHAYTDPYNWNGTFTVGWTNNPAWILYGLLTNTRWGLGRFIDATAVDKWSFYQAALSNDEWVADGLGSYSPRWTCNCVINTRQDAWQVLTAVASSMMATLYFAGGTVFLSQDRGGENLSTPRLFGPADVVNGVFDYTGADFRSRYTAVAVTWNDPEDQFKPAVELVQDAQLVAEQGFKEYQVTAFGVTNRGQAIRYGRWMIYTSQYETEAVSFQCGLENADIRPGELIQINDPGRMGDRLSGRLLHDDGADTITLDLVPQALTEIGGWTIYMQIGSAAEGQKPTVYAAAVLESMGGSRFRISSKPAGAVAGVMYMLAISVVYPTWWRVAVVSDQGKGVYQVLATERDLNKFTYVDSGWLIPEPPHSLIPTGPLTPPSNLNFAEYIYLDATGRPQFGVIVSWSASRDPRVNRYQLEMSGPNGDYRRFEVPGITQEVPNMRQGLWDVRLRAFDNLGRYSATVAFSFTPTGLSAKPLPPAALYITPQGGNLITLTWTPTGEIDVAFYWIKWTGKTEAVTWDRATTSIARVDRNTTQVNTPMRAGTYMIKTIDSLGQESVDWIAAVLEPQQTEASIFFNETQQPEWLGTVGAHFVKTGPEMWLPPPSAPEVVPPGIFPGDRGVALNKAPTRGDVYDFSSPTPEVVYDFDGPGLPAGATLGRASTGWYFNSTPALTSAASNVARFDYTTGGIFRGLLNEPAATNSVRNASAAGAVIGTPGTLPTFWTQTQTITQVVATGTESGIPYIDIRFVGTTASGSYSFNFEGNNTVAALVGQTWTGSVYLRLLAGNFTNINTAALRIKENNAAGTNLTVSPGVAFRNIVTSAALRTQLFSTTYTLPGATAAFANPVLWFTWTTGVAVDLTIRIGLPQFLRVAAAAVTSPIVTSSAAVTRAADVLTLAVPAETYDVTIVRENGTTIVPAVAIGGSYVVPTDPSPLQSVKLSLEATGFDLGAPTLVTMTGYVEGYGSLPGAAIANWIPLSSAVPLAKNTSQEWDAHIEARVSQDGVTFAPWFPLKSTVITGRVFEWRMVGLLYDIQTTLRAIEAGVLIEVPLRSVQGDNLLLDGTGHATVTYAAPFLQTPVVQLTSRESLSPGGSIVITESDENHFRVEHRTSSGAAATNGRVDYFVQGYGGHS